MRYERALFVSAVSCLTGVFACAAANAAAIVYDGGPSDLAPPTLASAPFMNAGSFALSAGANTITGAEWWGSCPDGPCPATTFDVSVYSDQSGAPGASVATLLTNGDANQTATGETITNPPSPSFPEYVYTIGFAPVTLTPGDQYWLVINETAPISGAGWGIRSSSSPPAGQKIAIFDNGWIVCPTRGRRSI